MNCPRCEKPTSPRSVAGDEIDFCESCGGMFLDAGQLNRIAEPTAGDLEYSTIDRDPLRHEDAFGPIRCPSCDGATMQKVEFNIETDIILDHCAACAGFWLDGKELERINAEVRKLNEASTENPDPPLLWLTRFIESLPR